jgi:hypothetical protein
VGSVEFCRTVRGPLHVQRRTVQPQDGNGGVPLVRRFVQRPHERVPVVGARHNLVVHRRPVHATDDKVVLGKQKQRGRGSACSAHPPHPRQPPPSSLTHSASSASTQQFADTKQGGCFSEAGPVSHGAGAPHTKEDTNTHTPAACTYPGQHVGLHPVGRGRIVAASVHPYLGAVGANSQHWHEGRTGWRGAKGGQGTYGTKGWAPQVQPLPTPPHAWAGIWRTARRTTLCNARSSSETRATGCARRTRGAVCEASGERRHVLDLSRFHAKQVMVGAKWATSACKHACTHQLTTSSNGHSRVCLGGHVGPQHHLGTPAKPFD